MRPVSTWSKKSTPSSVYWCHGFTLSEVMITVGIVGILSSIALPNYFRQIQRTHQAEANATMAQMMAMVTAFADEFGTQPKQWVDLNSVRTLMTNQGPAVIKDGELTQAITLPGERYQLNQINSMNSDKYFVFEAKATNTAASNYNIIACIDLKTGASDQIIGGRNDKPAKETCLTCKGQANETDGQANETDGKANGTECA